MKWKLPNLSRWRPGFIGAALSTVAGLTFLILPLGSDLTGLSYDSLFLFRSNVPVQHVVILYMDLESETRLGQLRRQSLDRAIHARLLERLKEHGPRVVVFDYMFVPSPDDPSGDEKLVNAARSASNVVVAAKPTADVQEGELVDWVLTPPFPNLREVVAWGVSEAVQVDGTIRRHHHRADLKVPSMAWRAAEKTMAHPPPPFQPRWINYYGPPGFLEHFSYYQVFATNAADAIPMGALSNKVVFVGGLYDIGFAGGKRVADMHTIPHSRWTGRLSPGVEICATAYLNLVRGDWLRRLSPWVETGLIVLVGGVSGLTLASRRPIAAVLCAALGFALAGTVTIFITWQELVWFPWLIIGAVQLPMAAGWSVLAHTGRLYQEKRAAEQALAIVRRGEEEPSQEGELEKTRTVPFPTTWVTPNPSASPWAASPDQAVPVVPDHELLRCIGQGAFGQVWLARDIIGTFHAVKIVYRQNPRDSSSLDREFNGIRNFTPLSRSHPGLVHILHVGRNEAAGYIYCVMELGDDETTGQQINPDTYSAKNLSRELKKRGRLPLLECLQLGIQLADALEHLHRHKLIHRDIKPSNIIFVGGVPKFADIGLVTAVAGEGEEASVVGTMGRMAPEGPGKPSADVYGLGLVLYEAGFGLSIDRFPELPTEIIQAADKIAMFQLNQIILKASERIEARRYPTAEALRVELETLLKQLTAPGSAVR